MSKPNAAERAHMAQVASLPCCVCGYWLVEVHHLTGAGMALRASHYDTIPLCAQHHRTGGYGVAIHAGQRTWEKNFGMQRDLLERVQSELGVTLIP
jgi:hypothetical protein